MTLTPESALISTIIGGTGAVIQGVIPTDRLSAVQKRLLAVGIAVVAGVFATVASPDFHTDSPQDMVVAAAVALGASQTAYAMLLTKLTENGWFGLRR